MYCDPLFLRTSDFPCQCACHFNKKYTLHALTSGTRIERCPVAQRIGHGSNGRHEQRSFEMEQHLLRLLEQRSPPVAESGDRGTIDHPVVSGPDDCDDVSLDDAIIRSKYWTDSHATDGSDGYLWCQDDWDAECSTN